ncbi:hypothetical protein D3C71_1264100 [compost metagenome]
MARRYLGQQGAQCRHILCLGVIGQRFQCFAPSRASTVLELVSPQRDGRRGLPLLEQPHRQPAHASRTVECRGFDVHIQAGHLALDQRTQRGTTYPARRRGQCQRALRLDIRRLTVVQKIGKCQVRDVRITVQNRVHAQRCPIRMTVQGDGVGHQPGACVGMAQQSFKHYAVGGR